MELLCIRWFFVLNRHCKNLIMALGFTIVTVLCITLILILKENEYNAEALTSNTTSNATSSVTLSNRTAGKDIIVIDTDAGVDDAVAILALLNDPKLGQSVVGITCVRGNTEVKNVAKNVLKILKIANRMEIPVYVGSSKNLLENPDHGDYFGKDGMGDANYPEEQPRSMLQKEQASVFLSSVVNKYPGKVTIAMLGPMTNIALATRLNSNFMKQVKKMVALGGVLKGGTMRPGVEFNIFMDPHAASLVMEELSLAGKKMTMLPSDTVKANLIDKAWRTSKLGTIKSKKIYFMNKIEARELNKTSLYWEPFDFYVSVILMRPEVITNKNSYYAEVETEGKFAKGTVIFDYSNILNKTNNVEVILSVDKKVVKSISLEYLP